MIASPARAAILAFAPGVWGWPDFAGSPRYHLWTLAGRGWPVLYVEPPQRWLWQARRWQAPDRPFHVLTPAQVPPFAVAATPARWVAAAWRLATARTLADEGRNELRRLLGLDELNPQWPPVIAWLGAPWQAPVARRLPAPWPRVVHVYDELAASPALRPWQQEMLAEWEDDLLGQATLVACSSEPQRATRAVKAGRVELLENAVRDEFLAPAKSTANAATVALVERLCAVPRPRIAYGGVADLRVDAALLAGAMKAVPEAHLVFLGVKATSFEEAPLRALGDRVHYLGQVPYGAYPALYAEADALVLAHHRNNFTRAMFPEKLNEYLASGRPIVSVPLPEVDRVAREATVPGAIRLASDAASMAEQLRAALAEGDDAALNAERRRLVAARTWSAAGDRLEGWLADLVNVGG